MRLKLEDGAPIWQLWAVWARLVVGIATERALWISLAAGLLFLAIGYQSPRALLVDVGGPLDSAFVQGFQAAEQSGQATFRWSGANSALVFPGLGRPTGPVTVHLQLSSGRSKSDPPLTVQVAANGHPLSPQVLTSTSESHVVTLVPSWIGPAGELRLDFASPTFRSGADKRDLGFIIDFVRVELPTGATLPALPQLGWLLLSGALVYLFLRSVWVRTTASGVLTAAYLALCASLVAVQRLLLTSYADILVYVMLVALALTLLAEPATRVVASAAGWRGERALPEWAWTGLRALLLASAAVKIGGLLYPATYIIDATFHLKEITYMAEGRPWQQFFGKSLAFAVMPKDEWGEARSFIPYSPFFYVIAAPLARLPLDLATSVAAFSGILETLKIPLVFLLGLALGGVRGAGKRALGSATLYSLIPATFLLLQWGNWPTTTSLWLLTAWAAFTCLFWQRFAWWPIWIVSTALLTLTFLSYTVSAVYTGMFVVMLVVAGFVLASEERKKWLWLGLSLVLATVLSIIIFYGQYIGVILSETLPTFGKAVQDQGKLTTLRPTLGAFLSNTIARSMQTYDLAVVYVVGAAGVLWFFLRGRLPGGRGAVVGIVARPFSVPLGGVSWKKIWTGAWLLVFPLVTLADFWVDQALKEFWYALPAIAVVGAAWLLVVQSKGKANRLLLFLAWLVWATLAWQSISLWVFRLLFHNR